MRGQMQPAPDGAAGIQPGHQLADAVDQDVLVKQRGQPPDRRRHGDAHPVVGIVENAQIGTGGQREHRMFHRGHVVLGQRIKDVADEEIRRLGLRGRDALGLDHRRGRAPSGSVRARGCLRTPSRGGRLSPSACRLHVHSPVPAR